MDYILHCSTEYAFIQRADYPANLLGFMVMKFVIKIGWLQLIKGLCFQGPAIQATFYKF
jgi:hypothetical protein